ncbi:Toll/interleukin-1 receptor domain-containing protein [Tanacetum coccineum]|uniref:Toll/interleukin-1 receptor domain-containing protein n=1 Tax=Tanacetum coccineum TaxID=301880 RepID=A0ABQ5BA10_9ASTR
MASSSTNSSIPKKKKKKKKSFKYDVFLSFRGEDTNNFVGHLYDALQQKGIRTYKDDEKIKKGKTIDNQLIKSIEDSRFYIIVFSKNYASSSWCLDELVKIMECQKAAAQAAYPIFYDVEPTEVRKQSGPINCAFLKNEKKEAAGKWIEALKQASNLAGWDLKAAANGALYDQISIHFEGKSFVENVREVSKASLSGLKKLQKQIVSSVLNKQEVTIVSVHDRTNMIKKIMCGRKVLIVDVDNIDQLKVLASEPNWYAFRREIPIQGYKELSEQVVQYDGIPLTIKVLGSLLCGQKEPRYYGLEADYKDIFLDVACILKGWDEEDAIRALESHGFHARNGIHDHIEEMGRDIVRRLHPDEPNRHSRLWNCKESEDILANEWGTQATKCITLRTEEYNADILMKGLANMKDLRFLDVYYKRHVYSGSNGNCNEVR